MALIYFEGFENWSSMTDAVSTTGWTGTGSLTQGTGRYTGKSFFLGSSGQYVNYAVNNLATITVGFGVMFTTISTTSQTFFQLMDGSSVQLQLVRDGTTGNISLQRNTTTLATGSTVIGVGNWYFIELTAVINDSTGSYELRINGTTEFSGSSQDTKNTANAYTNGVRLNRSGSGSPYPNFDDLYIRNDSTFLGDVQVETLNVSANSSVAWTPLSSTNASNVDEATPDGDTSYNSTTSTATTDLFTVTSLSNTPANIYGVKIAAALRNDDAGSQTVRTKMKNGTTTSNGSSHAVGASYIMYEDVYTTNPDTSAAFTASDISSLLIGYENV